MAKGFGSGQDDHWMIIDMGSDLSIAGFAVQAGAEYDGYEWINSFNAESWKDGGSPETLFNANYNIAFTNYPKLHSEGQYAEVFFRKSVVARYFKISVVSFENSPAMRVGALQCTVKATEPESCPIQSVVSTDNTITFSPLNMQDGKVWLDFEFETGSMYCVQFDSAGEVNVKKCYLNDVTTGASVTGASVTTQPPPPAPKACVCENGFAASPHDPLCLGNNFPQCVDKGCEPYFGMKYGRNITINGKTALETFCLAEAKACQKGEYVGSKCCTCPNGVPAERESADCNADGDQKCMGCDKGYFMFPTGPFTNECRLIQVV